MAMSMKEHLVIDALKTRLEALESRVNALVIRLAQETEQRKEKANKAA